MIDDDLTIAALPHTTARVDAEDRCPWCGSVFIDHACHMDGRVRP
jgi:hypothetical protein